MEKGVGLIIIAIVVAALLGLVFLAAQPAAPEEVSNETQEEPEMPPGVVGEEEAVAPPPSGGVAPIAPSSGAMDLTAAVPIVMVIVVIFIALMSMLASTTADPRLQAWVKTEIRELVAGVLLIFIITTYVLGSGGISVALTGQSDYIDASEDIIDGWIAHYDIAFRDIIRAATIIRSAATYSTYTNIPLWYFSLNYSVNPLGGIAILLGTMNLAAQALTNAIFIAEGIRLLISFLQVTVPPVLLPLAFVLRIIPFTRKLGNTMISICLAAIIFLPFSVILADALNDSIPNPDRPDPHISEGQFNRLDAVSDAMMAFEPFCQSMPIRGLLSLGDVYFALIVCLPLLFIPVAGPGLYAGCYNLVKEVVYPLINVVFQLGGALLLMLWEGVYGTESGQQAYVSDVFGVMQPFLRDVNNLVLLGYLDFILIAIVTLAGARSISAALGGEWYMAGIQRLI